MEIAAKKISQKYKKMRIKKKRVQSPKIVELPSDTDEAIDLPVVSNESA